jgi:hypothetical protein
VRSFLWLALLIAACETESEQVDAILVAHYSFDELSGGLTQDVGGFGLHGTCTLCPSLEAGKVGNALRFNGGDQQVDVAPDARFDSRTFSVAAWVKLDVAPPIPGCPALKGAAWQLCIDQTLHPTFGTAVASATLTLGAFHHVAIVYDGAMKRIYLDGTEVHAEAGTVPADASELALGAELVGVADEIFIYGGVLSASQRALLAGS